MTKAHTLITLLMLVNSIDTVSHALSYGLNIQLSSLPEDFQEACNKKNATFSNDSAAPMQQMLSANTTTLDQQSFANSSTSASGRPYGEFCDTEVVGEKQIMSTEKKVISFSIFSDPPGAKIQDFLL